MTSEPISEIDAARLDYEAVSQKFKRLEERRDGIAYAFAVAKRGGHHADASEAQIAKAAPHMGFVTAYPHRIVSELADITVDLDQLWPELNAAKARHQALKQAAADKFALSLAPRYRASIAELAAALEAMSLALAGAAEIQAELAAAHPEHPRSSRIPDLAAAFVGCQLADPRSAASQFARIARDLELL